MAKRVYTELDFDLRHIVHKTLVPLCIVVLIVFMSSREKNDLLPVKSNSISAGSPEFIGCRLA